MQLRCCMLWYVEENSQTTVLRQQNSRFRNWFLEIGLRSPELRQRRAMHRTNLDGLNTTSRQIHRCTARHHHTHHRQQCTLTALVGQCCDIHTDICCSPDLHPPLHFNSTILHKCKKTLKPVFQNTMPFIIFILCRHISLQCAAYNTTKNWQEAISLYLTYNISIGKKLPFCLLT